MAYSPPAGDAAQFETTVYVAPGPAAVDYAVSAYDPPGGGGVGFAVDDSGYEKPDAAAVGFALAVYQVPEALGVDFSVSAYSPPNGASVDFHVRSDDSIASEDLPAAAITLALAVSAQLHDEPLAAELELALGLSQPLLDDVDTDFWALCTLELTASGALHDEPLTTAAAALQLSAAGALYDESLTAAPLLRLHAAAAADGAEGGQRPSPGINVNVGARWRAARDTPRPVAAGWGDAPIKRAEVAVGWSASPSPVAVPVASGWDALTPLQTPLASAWQRPSVAPASEVAAVWGYPPLRDRPLASGWDDSARPREAHVAGRWRHPPPKDAGRLSAWYGADPHGKPHRGEDYNSPLGGQVAFSVSAGGYAPPSGGFTNFNAGASVGNRRSVATDTGLALPFRVRTPARDRGMALRWGLGGAQSARDPTWEVPYPHQPPVIDDPEAPAVLPAYLLMPSIEVTRLSDGAEILVNAANMETDQDSWAWTFTLYPARVEDLDLMRPTAGTPVEIQVRVNGWTWHALVESYSRSREMPQHTWAVRARSLGALFAAPYGAPATRLETADRLAQQLAADEVTLPGWSLQWDAVDWLVPGGVFSYQDATAMDAITRLARAAGATVATARDERKLIVAPRYPAAPWNWQSTTPDVVLPDALIRRLSAEWQAGPAYNAVYVSGQQGGKLVYVERDGTGGNNPAPSIVDALTTTGDPGRARGIVILGQSAARESVDIETYLLPDPEPPGLIEPGALIEVAEGSGSWVGLVTGTRVTAGRQNALTVRQTLTVERNYAT